MHITSPIAAQDIQRLRVGDSVLLSGIIYTARDAAHQRLTDLLAAGEPLPFDLRGQAIYYAGPCPAPPGRAIGSIGPTTSTRMDSYTPALLQAGLRVMIGKGARNSAVIDAIREHGAVYLAAVGGAGALLSQCVSHAEPVAFADLGTEAIVRLTICNMPLVVAVDCMGRQLYH
ncbi:MAG: FumA C-terminus/TtdB family hydratase beta subunit [Oscillospiraceae bacterium]|nr:FumA C-terminus/TtdB family hydratase beta subunit [Oscillospiraceae bacterium]